MKKVKRIFVNERNRLRLPWFLLLAVCLYAASTVGVSRVYWLTYNRLMEIWGITGRNIALAPGFVQALYKWSYVIVQALQNVLLIATGVFLYRLTGTAGEARRKTGGKRVWWTPAALGAACLFGLWGFLMLSGSVRLGWRITKPAFSVNTLAVLLTASTGAAAEAAFLYTAVYGEMKKRLPVWAAQAGMMLVSAILMLAAGGQPVMLLSGGLTALVCCCLTDRYGALPAAGFRFAWVYLETAVFGFAGASAALYETYPVNLYWLSGGNAGLMNGWAAAAVLAGTAGWLLKDKIKIGTLLRKARSKSAS